MTYKGKKNATIRNTLIKNRNSIFKPDSYFLNKKDG